MNLTDRHSGKIGRDLTYMLNWVDWMGLIVKMNLIDKELLFGSLYSVVREIIKESSHQIQCDIDNPDRGERWWGNVLFLAYQKEIDIDIKEEANKLRKKWFPIKTQNAPVS